MDDSIASPYTSQTDEKVLGRVAKFMRVISGAGLTPEIMQTLINDAAMRRRFVVGLKQLLVDMSQPVGAVIEIDASHLPDMTKLIIVSTRYTSLIEHQEKFLTMFSTRLAFDTFLASLRSDRERGTAIMIYDLDGQGFRTVGSVAEYYKVSTASISQHIKSIISHTALFCATHMMQPITQSHLDFERLGFDFRLRNAIYRSGVSSLEDLPTVATAEFLRNRIGMAGLREIESTLATLGLTLE